jgi:uncharacterized pyridoxamine 5'-phosphate oxidase family protein
MNEILKFLSESRYFFFATVEDGEPRVRPFGFFMEFEGKLYIGMGDNKLCFRQIKENPNFEICAYNEGSGFWMRLRGTAVCDQRPEVNEAAFVKAPFLREKYTQPGGPRHVHFYIKDGVATFQDFAYNPRSVKIG